jgi:hypothetical protein
MDKDLNRFKECCAAFGAERRRWPPREQPLYDRLAGTPEGRAMLADAERADGFLDALEPAVPDPRLAHRVAALARPAWRRIAVPAAALAVSAVVGFVVGFAQVQGSANADVASRLLLGPQSLQEFGL